MKQEKLPQGFRDSYGQQAWRKSKVSQAVMSLLAERGYTRIETPLVEYESVFSSYELNEAQGTYRFYNGKNETLVLRPDLTLPIARFLTTNAIDLPNRFCYLGDLFAIKKEHAGERNQMTQAGVELVGFASRKAELECLCLMNLISRQFLQGQAQIELSHAELVDVILDSISMDKSSQNTIKQALFNKNIPAYEACIAPYEMTVIYPFLQEWPFLFGSLEEVTSTLEKVALPPQAEAIIKEILQLAKQVALLPDQEVRIDLSCQAPQDYYTGLVFKAYVDGLSEYIMSGGRYDKLLANFKEEPEKAVGMGLDIDLLTSLVQVDMDADVNGYIYFTDATWTDALALMETYPNYKLALTESLEKAKKQAQDAGLPLLIAGE